MNRNQSEDYCRPEDVLVYRDTPFGIVANRVIDEKPRFGTEPIQVECYVVGRFLPRTVLASGNDDSDADSKRFGAART